MERVRMKISRLLARGGTSNTCVLRVDERPTDSEVETKYAPENWESVSRKDFHLIEECASIIRVTSRTVDTFVNRGHRAGLWEERRAFVGGDVSLRIVRWSPHYQFLWL